MSLIHQERALSFLRLPLTAKRRRVKPVIALLRPLLRAAALAAVLAAGAAWALSSPVFALREVQVETGARVSEAWVRQRVAIFGEHNLLRIDLLEVRTQLLDHEWVRAVELKKQLPDHLRVRVLEHRPAALLRSEGALYYLDAEGGVITRADEAAGWLIVDAPDPGGASVIALREQASRRGALELAALLASEVPPWSGRLEGIEILGEDDYRLEIEGLPYALLVRPGTARERMALFDRLRQPLAAELEAMEAVDLRFTGRIVLRPTAARDFAGRTSEG
ncbi:MAG TPA: FtsQ-type POTRA domain-containing protein [Thermoanaerobaculia bacterium]|nr:FtsQ-type POTRA domain-containing protein [Thermoanaerobaculia bacterium]